MLFASFRVEAVMVQLQAKLPVLSDAEKNMHKSLKSIDAKLQDFHASVKEVCSVISLVSLKF